jgi:hypothetical protein
VFQDGDGLMEPLKSKVPGSDALHVVGGKLGAADFGLVFSELVVQRAHPALVQMFEQQRSQGDHPFRDIASDCREALPLHLDV